LTTLYLISCIVPIRLKMNGPLCNEIPSAQA
jgi:hypothetical protein